MTARKAQPPWKRGGNPPQLRLKQPNPGEDYEAARGAGGGQRGTRGRVKLAMLTTVQHARHLATIREGEVSETDEGETRARHLATIREPVAGSGSFLASSTIGWVSPGRTKCGRKWRRGWDARRTRSRTPQDMLCSGTLWSWTWTPKLDHRTQRKKKKSFIPSLRKWLSSMILKIWINRRK